MAAMPVWIVQGRHCRDCAVGWNGSYGDQCWMCGKEGANGWLNTAPK